MIQLWRGLQRAAEAVLMLMMGLMFAAFIAQVVFRYVLGWPLAWSEELCNFLWLWGILWGAAFVMRNHEDIRFDMLYNLLPHTAQRVATVLSSSAIVILLVWSLPMTWSYISFMHVEKSASMGMPMSLVFGLYLVFVVAMCVRHIGVAFDALRDRLPDPALTFTDPAALPGKQAP
jgi:C4-dicarboxylate transporter, DctQ subunit